MPSTEPKTDTELDTLKEEYLDVLKLWIDSEKTIVQLMQEIADLHKELEYRQKHVERIRTNIDYWRSRFFESKTELVALIKSFKPESVLEP